MRLLRVIPSLNPEGGGPVSAARLADTHIIAAGHTVEVLTLDDPDYTFSSDYPAKVTNIGPSLGKYKYNSKLVKWLKTNHHNFDALIIDGIWQFHSLATWIALKSTTKPYYVITHGMLGPWFKYKHPLKHLKKWIYWPWADYRVLRDSKAVIFTCEEERRLATKSFWLYKWESAVAPLGGENPPDKTDCTRAFFNEFKGLKNKRLIVFLGRLHEVKGCDLLIEAFSSIQEQYPDTHLVIVGSGDQKTTARLHEKSLALKKSGHITFTGTLSGPQKWGALYAAYAFCLPSHHENFGMAVIEALACEKPVLISNKVNIWKEIVNDGAGIVDEDSVSGTAHNLKKILSLPPDDYKKMQASAANCYKNRFDPEQSVKNLIDIIKCKN